MLDRGAHSPRDRILSTNPVQTHILRHFARNALFWLAAAKLLAFILYFQKITLDVEYLILIGQ